MSPHLLCSGLSGGGSLAGGVFQENVVLKLGLRESTCESLWKISLLQFESLFIGKDGYVAQKGKIHLDINL